MNYDKGTGCLQRAANVALTPAPVSKVTNLLTGPTRAASLFRARGRRLQPKIPFNRFAKVSTSEGFKAVQGSKGCSSFKIKAMSYQSKQWEAEGVKTLRGVLGAVFIKGLP